VVQKGYWYYRCNEAHGQGLWFGLACAAMALRGYGGGWRMDSTMIQPAMVLMRETSFPTAYYERPFEDPERYRDQEGGIPRAKRQMLERFFENDLNGGNPFVAASRSFFGFQTSSEGRGGMPLDHVFETMATRLLTDKQGYFSVHLFDNQVGQAFQRAGMQMNSPDRVSNNFAEVMIHMLTSTPRVWDTILETSLADLDPWEDPERTINVLSLKGGAMAESLLDNLGREKAGTLLATLREGNAGTHYTREEVAAAGEVIGENLDTWLQVWLDTTELPGFTVGDVQLERIADDEDGSPRYQVLAVIRNDETTDGLIRIDYRAGDRQSGLEQGSGDPILVAGNSSLEVGLVTSSPPRMVRVVPYLALNRDPFSLTLPPVDEERIVEAEPFTGSRDVDWAPAPDESIIVDDLDPGFSVEETSKGSWLRFAQGSSQEVETDQGLPIAQTMFRPAARWSRRSTNTAYGKYRHTMAMIKGGAGDRRAIFSADIPRAGEWELQYHVPALRRRSRGDGGGRGMEGIWHLTIEDGSGTNETTLDLSQVETGWNSLGSFEIADGEVRVVVSDKTDGRLVVADAIRWVPVSTGEIAEVR
jgi:hypothetical protein